PLTSGAFLSPHPTRMSDMNAKKINVENMCLKCVCFIHKKLYITVNGLIFTTAKIVLLFYLFKFLLTGSQRVLIYEEDYITSISIIYLHSVISTIHLWRACR